MSGFLDDQSVDVMKKESSVEGNAESRDNYIAHKLVTPLCSL